MYPCGYCELNVDYGFKAICCDNCDIWFHKSCASMSSTMYSELDSKVDWFCYRCHTHNCDTFHAYEYSLDTSNAFSVLMPTLPDEVFSSPVPQRPMAHSSPHGTQPAPAAAHIPSFSSSTKASTVSASSHKSTADPPIKGDHWRTLVLNINSIVGKAAALHDMLSYIKPDAVLITETKLNKDINTAEVLPSDLGYTVYRKDRCNEGGGGVALLVKSCYSSTDITPNDESSANSELIWVEVELHGHKKLLLSNYYRRPNISNTSQLEALQSSIESVLSKYKGAHQPIILGGDFNLPDICWENDCVKGSSQRKSLHEYFLTLVQTFSLTQLVTDCTRENSILDLVLTNSPNQVKSTHVIPGLSDHEAVVCDCSFTPRCTKKVPRTVHLFSKADWEPLRAEVRTFSEDYFQSLLDSTVEEKWTAFKNKLNGLLDKYVPSKRTTTRYNAPWMTNTLKRLSRKKKRLFKKAKKSAGKLRDTLWARYRTCKASFNVGIRHAREKFVTDIINSAFNDNDTKPFWKYVKSKRCDNTGISPLKDGGQLFSDSQSKADILNRQFTSVFNIEDTSDIPVLPGDPFPAMPDIIVDVRGVTKLLNNIKPNKASGPDSIPCRILKEAAAELAPVLTDIFNASLSSSTLPQDWKKANVAPVFKKGNSNSAENYRPISLTCVCCKLLEHIVCHSIRGHLDEHNILSIFQHGFRSGHSCDSQLLSTVHDLMSIFDSKCQVDVAVLDFSKAFDVVPHQRLLGKVKHYGVNGKTLAWISNFLSGRTQRVVVDGSHSAWSTVHSGVPQGTVLGPLLFLLYINDLPDCITSRVRLFADDCLVYRRIKNTDDQLALQRDLDSLETWANTWGMKFNPSKCTVLSISRTSTIHKFYTLCGTVLQQVNEAKYLGVTLSDDLQWSKHISNLTAKASSTLGLLHRNLSKCPQRLREQAYISLIRSRLEYCSAIWDPHTAKDTNALESIQRRAARLTVQDYSRYTSVSALLKDLDWSPLKDRRRDIRLTLLFKIVKGKVAVQAEGSLVPADSRTRSSHGYKFRHIQANSTQYKNSFFVKSIPEWNSLPASCLEADTATAFKEQLRRAP